MKTFTVHVIWRYGVHLVGETLPNVHAYSTCGAIERVQRHVRNAVMVMASAAENAR